MGRIVIKRDEQGAIAVIGEPPADNGFFDFALNKVMSGKFNEISWEPIVWR